MVKGVHIVAGVVYGLSLLAVIAQVPERSPGGTRPTNRPSLRAERSVQLIGASLNVYHTEPFHLYVEAVDEIAETGFNGVQVVTPAFQRHGASPRVEIQVGPGRGPTRPQLIELLVHAKRRGLETCLMPQINFTDPRGNEWRGKIQPTRWGPWWWSYQKVIDYFLDIAVQANVDVFCVGCELISTQNPDHLLRWRALAHRVRQRFGGRLIYSTNWDAYDRVGFWEQLDAVGISGYWDLTTRAEVPDEPTDEEIALRWHEIRQKILVFAEQQKRPVLLTELGYPSLPWALKDPWNYIHPDHLTADHATQARALSSFLAAWQGLIVPAQPPGQGPGPRVAHPDPRVAGVFFYKWDVFQSGDDQDTGYGVRGKPAYDLIRTWLSGRLP